MSKFLFSVQCKHEYNVYKFLFTSSQALGRCQNCFGRIIMYAHTNTQIHIHNSEEWQVHQTSTVPPATIHVSDKSDYIYIHTHNISLIYIFSGEDSDIKSIQTS